MPVTVSCSTEGLFCFFFNVLIRHLRQALRSLPTSQSPHCKLMSHYGDTNEIFMRLAAALHSEVGRCCPCSCLWPVTPHRVSCLWEGAVISSIQPQEPQTPGCDCTVGGPWSPCSWVLGLENLLQPLPKAEALERH